MEKVENDYKEFLKLLNKHKVRYCVVGAYAFGFHAIPRYTKDIDILVEPTPNNAVKVYEVIKEFGFGSVQLTAADFSKPNQVVQLGYEPVRIDLITSIKGCNFSQVWKYRKKGDYGGVKVNFIGFEELVKSKSKTGRTQDKADLEKLELCKKRKKLKNR